MMKRRIVEFLVLAMLALGASPVGAAIWNWSTTAGTNATADPTINWSEGMSPSSVNDSARAMMAAIAAWRNDISGVNTTGGTSTAYTLTTSEGVNTTPVDGQMLAFIPHATNGISPTLTADGGNTYPIWLNGSAVGAASLIAGTPYRVSFKSGSSAWVLEAGYGNPYNTALGALMPSTLPTAPNSNFIVPNGQCISTTTYATYWVALGSPASGSCPGGQFAVIDMRGRNPTALDNIGGVAANVLTSSANGCGTSFTTMGAKCVNGNESRTLNALNLPPITSTGNNSISVVAPASGQFAYGAAASMLNDGFTGGGGNYIARNTAGWAFGSTMTGVNAITVVSTGTTSTPVPTVSPNIGLYYYLRVI